VVKPSRTHLLKVKNPGGESLKTL